MTPEQELELLIAEQATDDTYFIGKPAGEIGWDGPAPGSRNGGNVEDFVGVDLEGEIVSFLPRPEESVFGVSLAHGTRSTYENLRCRCLACRAANAAYRRQRRAGGHS